MQDSINDAKTELREDNVALLQESLKRCPPAPSMHVVPRRSHMPRPADLEQLPMPSRIPNPFRSHRPTTPVRRPQCLEGEELREMVASPAPSRSSYESIDTVAEGEKSTNVFVSPAPSRSSTVQVQVVPAREGMLFGPSSEVRAEDALMAPRRMVAPHRSPVPQVPVAARVAPRCSRDVSERFDVTVKERVVAIEEHEGEKMCEAMGLRLEAKDEEMAALCAKLSEKEARLLELEMDAMEYLPAAKPRKPAPPVLPATVRPAPLSSPPSKAPAVYSAGSHSAASAPTASTERMDKPSVPRASATPASKAAAPKASVKITPDGPDGGDDDDPDDDDDDSSSSQSNDNDDEDADNVDEGKDGEGEGADPGADATDNGGKKQTSPSSSVKRVVKEAEKVNFLQYPSPPQLKAWQHHARSEVVAASGMGQTAFEW